MSIRSQFPSLSIPKSGLLLLLIAGTLLSAGCTGQFGPPTPQEIPGGQLTGTPTTLATPSSEPTVAQPFRNMPAELPASGFIERSYGYVQYTPPPEYRLTWIESNSRKDASGNVIIYGRVKNEGPGSLAYLQMTFNLFDPSGNLVGNAHAQVEYLGAGKVWRFESDPAPGTNYQYFEISGILAQ